MFPFSPTYYGVTSIHQHQCNNLAERLHSNRCFSSWHIFPLYDGGHFMLILARQHGRVSTCSGSLRDQQSATSYRFRWLGQASERASCSTASVFRSCADCGWRAPVQFFFVCCVTCSPGSIFLSFVRQSARTNRSLRISFSCIFLPSPVLCNLARISLHNAFCNALCVSSCLS